MENKKVTIYDVAEEAGVSLATVSRVINGAQVVKESTRQKVLEAIDKLDFKPNQIARGLATSKTTTIAVIFPQSLFGHVKDMVGGIGDAGRLLDYNILMYTTDDIGDGNSIETIIEKVIKTRADGILLFYNEQIKEELELIHKYNIPTVVIGYRIDDAMTCSIYLDAREVGYSITKDYLDKGKTDIVFMKPRQNLVDLDQFVKGMEEAYKEAGIPFADDRVLSVSSHYEKNLPEFVYYFKKHRHQVVFTGYDKQAVAVVNAAQDNGIKIPDDMEVVGMMDTSYAIMCRPALTSIHLPIYDMGAMAVRLLTKMLNNEPIEERQVSVVNMLIKRQTTN
ncbi:MAG: LacI family DNA-binding transcriptional regulator [Erysipelotrichaceae bacterium]|nr:LacI family DNA-binding transcriptional regulator [Erysipelotrichaceae bacterium]